MKPAGPLILAINGGSSSIKFALFEASDTLRRHLTLAYYLNRTAGMTAAQFQRLVNRESGLLGISEISSDMQDLLAREAGGVRAAEASSLFRYQAKKWIGSFAAALGGLDTLVFAGGIGEHAPPVRARICEGLGFLGAELSESRNAHDEGVISSESSRATVRVIGTDEDLMIARSVVRSCAALIAERKQSMGVASHHGHPDARSNDSPEPRNTSR